MEVSEILAAAQEALDEAGLREELHVAGFEKAVDLIAYQRVSVPPGSPKPEGGEAIPPDATATPSLAAIATRLGISLEAVTDIYFEDGQELGIGLSTSQLDRAKATATKQLALLLAAGRQGGGYDEEWTPLEKIRTVCADFGKLDDSNFASTIHEMGQMFQIRGSRRKREVKVKRPGFEEAGRLARVFAGDVTE